MTPTDILLSSNISINDVKASIESIVISYSKIFDKLTQSNSRLKNNIIGVNLENIFTTNIHNKIKVNSQLGLLSNEYEILSDNLPIETNKIITTNPNIVVHKDFVALLNDKFVSVSNEYNTKQLKNTFNNNLLSVNELGLLDGVDVVSKQTETLNVEDVQLNSSYISSMSIVNYELLKELYFVGEKVDNVVIKFNKQNKTIKISNSNFLDVSIGLTDEELTGAGAKLSDYILIEAPVKEQQQINSVFINVNAPNLTYTILANKEKLASYTPTADDNVSAVANELQKQLLQNTDIAVHLSNGYYSSSPVDDDDEIKLGWFVRDTEEGKNFSVELTEDNSEEHDIKVEWNKDGGILTVIYASDGDDVIYPTIGELIEAVKTSNTPIEVELINSDYTIDDEYPYELEFDLEYYNDGQIVIKTNRTILIEVNNKIIMDNKLVQSFQEGKHQKGQIEVSRFERGHVYYVGIDNDSNKKIIIDTTENNNPNIQTTVDFVSTLVNKLNNTEGIDSFYNNNIITIINKDYGTHSFETSGEDGYFPPIKRNVTVKKDIENYVFQGDEQVVIYKNKGFNGLKSPINKTDIQEVVEQGVVFSPSKISSCRLKKDDKNYLFYNNKDHEVTTNFQASIEIDNIFKQMPQMLPNKPIKYVFNNSIKAELDIVFSKTVGVEKYGLFSSPKTQIIPSVYYQYLDETELELIERKMLGLEDTYFLNTALIINEEFKQISPHLYKELDSFQHYSSINKTNPLFVYEKNNLFNINKPIWVSAIEVSEIDDFIKKQTETWDLSTFIGNNNLLILVDNATAVTIYEVVDILIEYPELLLNVEFERLLNEIFETKWFKYLLMEVYLNKNTENLLEQMVYLLDRYFFTFEDCLFYIDNNTFRNTVIEIDTEESEPNVDYGLDGESEEQVMSFNVLYIRQYKKRLRSSNVKQLAELTTSFYKGLTVEEKVMALKLVPMVIVDNKGNKKQWFNYKTIKTSTIQSNMFDNILLQDILYNGYFPQNTNLFGKNISTGYSSLFKDSVWGSLIKSINFDNEGEPVGVQDSLSTLRILYSNYTIDDAWSFAAILSLANEHSCNQYHPIVSSLHLLFYKLYSYFMSQSVEINEENFNKIVGLLFKNDEDSKEILPYISFKYFLSAIGKNNLIEESSKDEIGDKLNLRKFVFYMNNKQFVAVNSNNVSFEYNQNKQLRLIAQTDLEELKDI